MFCIIHSKCVKCGYNIVQSCQVSSFLSTTFILEKISLFQIVQMFLLNKTFSLIKYWYPKAGDLTALIVFVNKKNLVILFVNRLP